MTESMGPIYDRTTEHLGSSDAMVIRTRRRLLGAARALVDEGSVILPEGTNWVEATAELRQAYVAHPELDPALAGRIGGQQVPKPA